MKHLFLFLLITFIFSNNLFSQTNLKVGDKAPTIYVTDYILNTPKDKTLTNKYILLEFWATWCAPCLGAVPHLNELQAKYKDRKDISFISMTDESTEKVLRTLKKIEFKTIVVSDQSKKTQNNFAAIALPHTVLIDKNGIIKWIGVPWDMTDMMFEDFINGKDILTKPELENTTTNSKTDENPESIRDYALKIVRNKQTQYIFSLLNASDTHSSTSSVSFSRGEYVKTGSSFTSILSDLLNIPEMSIIVPDSIKAKKFDVLYKNVNIKNKEECIEDIKMNLLKSLKLKEKSENRMTEIYILRVIDKNKLQISEENEGIEHSGDNDTHFTFLNVKIGTVIKTISTSEKIIIEDETNLMGNYDFLIKRVTVDDIKQDFESYGLGLEKASKEIEYFIYE